MYDRTSAYDKTVIPSMKDILKQVKERQMNDVKTEGTVNLSISELDRLRTQIKDLTQERDDLKLHAQEVKLNITVEEEYLTTRAVDDWDAYRRDSDRHRYAWSVPKKIEAVKEKRIVTQSESYMGLQEVIQELRREEEARVIQKLGELDRQIIDLKNREETLKTKQTKELQELRNKQTEEIEKINTAHADVVKDLNKQINDLNGVITDQSKDDTIRQLRTEIETLKLKKSFWSFLH